jgi:hypothetical protein
MSFVKTVLGIAVVVGICIGIFITMRDHGVKTPLETSMQMSNPAGSVASSSSAQTPPAAPASAAIALANDPRRTAPNVNLVDPNKIDPEMAKRYANALDAVELDGCNANGTVAVRVRGERIPHIVRSGQSLQMPDGLTLTVRPRGYPACRIMLYDGKTAIGEVAGF